MTTKSKHLFIGVVYIFGVNFTAGNTITCRNCLKLLFDDSFLRFDNVSLSLWLCVDEIDNTLALCDYQLAGGAHKDSLLLQNDTKRKCTNAIGVCLLFTYCHL